jgi:hypothetical protein
MAAVTTDALTYALNRLSRLATTVLNERTPERLGRTTLALRASRVGRAQPGALPATVNDSGLAPGPPA